MLFSTKILTVFVASCLALSAMAQQCACTQQFDASESCLSFIGGGPACEAVTCSLFYICNPDGMSLCEVSTTAINVIRPVEGTGNCFLELVDPATVTSLVESSAKNFAVTASADQTKPLATPAGSGPSISVNVEFKTFESDCTVTWTITDNGGPSTWTGPPNRAHIHGPAVAGSNAGALITIFNDQTLVVGTSFITGTPLTGSATVALSTCTSINEGLTYFNIHTAANGGGEARAHLLYEASFALATSAGTDAMALPLPLLETCVNAQFPMSNVPTNAHIHAPAKIGSNAGAIIQLFSSLTSLGGDACEIVSCFAVTDQQYNWIRDGMAYINIHTAANPGGELRGQISDMTVPAPSSRALVELELVDAKQAQDHNGCLLSRGRNYPLREEMGGFKSSCVTKRIA
eukprot:CAMPEP_0184715764 /NCGR_PEP_ID=MMETSP0314-20130426/5646_1 /TAXON_ID=38298 /ORGANISM="Rhodella maculata, Strain CCMP 736" /LENGTH=403 /DNA_ID=CAMNT_0027179019 /DNA_START=341 /DNA_END=1549 /DNA_ORIENTATION=+